LQEAASTSLRRPERFYGWIIVAVASVVSLSGVAFYNPVLGVFVRPFEEEFGWSRLTVSLVITVGNFAGALFAPAVGAILDRRGARFLSGAGMTVMVICLFALALTPSLWWFYVFFGIGRATAVGVIDLAVAVAVANWFIRRRGIAMGLATLGNRAGMALLPLLAQIMIVWWNWRAAWVALGIFVLIAGVGPSFRFLRRRPEDMGLLPDGDSVEVASRSARSATGIETSWSVSDATRTRAFWLITLATSSVFLVSGGINLHQMAHLQDQGLSSTVAVGVVAAFAVFGGLGGLLAGVLQHRIGSRWTFALSLAASAGGLVILIHADNIALAYIYGAWYGLFFGVVATMMAVIYADYFGRMALGRIRGVVAPINIVFNALGPPLAGWAFDVSGSYAVAFWAFTVLYLLAVLWVFLAGPPRQREGIVVLVQKHW